MYTISKEFHFSASHQLIGLPEEHPCSRLHGHNYVVTVELTSIGLNKVGFIVDYRDLEPIKQFIDNTLDHRHLNDIFKFNPTAENMAKFFFKKFRKDLKFLLISAVIVKETDKTAARYTLSHDEEDHIELTLKVDPDKILSVLGKGKKK
jgi:6-pyruvoyltetrahydropterin/6-carboxytetrahydropterin synthase